MPQRYSDFAPTQFDVRGLGLDDRQSWYVAPVSITRDSDPLAESNFETAKRILTEAGVEWEDHRFSHWGPGWFEAIIVEPTEAGRAIVESIADSLADYPVLDEGDYSDRECEARDETWDSAYRRAVERAIEDACGVDDVDQIPIGDLRSAFDRALEHVGGTWEMQSDGPYVYRFDDACKALARAIAKRYRGRPTDPRAAVRWVARFREATT